MPGLQSQCHSLKAFLELLEEERGGAYPDEFDGEESVSKVGFMAPRTTERPVACPVLDELVHLGPCMDRLPCQPFHIRPYGNINIRHIVVY